jgi:hypothetical protein
MMMMIEKTLEMQMEMRDDWTDFISLVFASLLFCGGAFIVVMEPMLIIMAV